jgi:hypothetical protein
MTHKEIGDLIRDMVFLIEELMPDEEYRGMYDIDVVLEEARKAILELKGE